MLGKYWYSSLRCTFGFGLINPKAAPGALVLRVHNKILKCSLKDFRTHLSRFEGRKVVVCFYPAAISLAVLIRACFSTNMYPVTVIVES